ncbi:hypothetical protein STEG23_021454 [Scotinomys teguina]
MTLLLLVLELSAKSGKEDLIDKSGMYGTMTQCGHTHHNRNNRATHDVVIWPSDYGSRKGRENDLNMRKAWLSKVGSPSSRIDRTDFSNEKTISKLEYSNFSIRY